MPEEKQIEVDLQELKKLSQEHEARIRRLEEMVGGLKDSTRGRKRRGGLASLLETFKGGED